MIGRLQGILAHKRPPQILIDIQGVGYEVLVSMHTFYELPEEDAQVKLYIHTVFREDGQFLYGFFDLQERALFQHIIKVNGVGPKLALAILSSMPPLMFQRCVEESDLAMLCKVPGIGKKTAERLVVEMRDRVVDWSATASGMGSTLRMDAKPSSRQDAISALVALGYKPAEASKVVNKIDDAEKSSEVLIREALRQL